MANKWSEDSRSLSIPVIPPSVVQIHQIEGFADDAAQWGETQGWQKDIQLVRV